MSELQGATRERLQICLPFLHTLPLYLVLLGCLKTRSDVFVSQKYVHFFVLESFKHLSQIIERLITLLQKVLTVRSKLSEGLSFNQDLAWL